MTKTLEELELDYNNAGAMLKAVVRDGDSRHAKNVLEEYKRASDAYYKAKYGHPKTKSTHPR